MQMLNYERLDRITRTVPPFRGSVNRFPIGSRRENKKYFLVREEDGQRVFDIVANNSWCVVDLTREEHDKKQRAGERNLQHRSDGWCQFVMSPNVLGTVRRDGTFEFTKKSYGMGDNTVMSKWSNGYFSMDSRRGGMVYSCRNSSRMQHVFHPIYKGMKMDTNTMQPVVPYEVSVYNVDRKKSKVLVGKYQHFYKVCGTMLKVMDVGAVLDIARELTLSDGGYRRGLEDYERAEKLINDAPLDAFALYAMYYNVNSFAYQLKRDSTHHGNFGNAYEQLFMPLKRRLDKEIYKADTEIFKEVPQEMGACYPTSEWGIVLRVNGQLVEQY